MPLQVVKELPSRKRNQSVMLPPRYPSMANKSVERKLDMLNLSLEQNRTIDEENLLDDES